MNHNTAKACLTRYLCIAASVAFFCLVACGDDSGNSASDELPESVEQFSDIKNIECNADRECAQIYIEEHDDYVQCIDSKWETVIASKPNKACAEAKSSSSKGKSSSSGKKQSSSSEKSSSSSKKSTASSSSVKESSSSVRSDLVGKVNWQYLNPNKEYGEITDDRDGQVYKTVKIGDQVWMAENLNFNYNEGSAKSSCYQDDADSCAYYGRLYTWAAAMDSAAKFSPAGEFCGNGILCSSEGDVRGVCPSGWHLPNSGEWSVLEYTARDHSSENPRDASKVLRSVNGWPVKWWYHIGTDDLGFSALLIAGGYTCFWINGELEGYFSNVGYGAKAYIVDLDEYFKELGHSNRDKFKECSVRCLKDVDSEDLLSSSSAKNSSSSIALVDSSTVKKGTMTDERDGKTYKTVTIGKQIWMAENLNYDYDVASSFYRMSACYNDVADSCDKYGRLYTWTAAVDSAAVFSDAGVDVCDGDFLCKLKGPVRGVCPSGWHLPDSTEWEILFAAVGGIRVAGKKLRSNSGWDPKNGGENGLDSYSFSVLPAGGRYAGDFFDIGEYSAFWVAVSADRDNACGWSFSDIRTSAGYARKINKRIMHSVRCIKDEN